MDKKTKMWARILACVLALLMFSGVIGQIIMYLF